ncbi:UDP-glucose/GDP-mannose dehydrogenase family protein [Hymenobacter busanensis]|uniref:UDP-glucose 6-dehydrogenase n=1 Tax=Hymenobacter busanensis TaxID=2607656 RepID=A0A7L4ZU60_9BACT|nr:nucleotide sugar dehydrogenase [Hymenobacter busanensis]KAA9339249.1 UDP-glucose/GDP-mannose dehydrogenase family protein [Hymenobacter busanensis]QHJ06989.1 nucleotide sugar dehydrogenase [Hymenobacter busanensis]
MITVLGLGFVGLTTALGFSKKGFKVYGIDVNEQRLAKIRRYEVPFYEPQLDEALRDELGQNFIIDAPLADAVNDSKIIIVCVGTPSHPDGSANLAYLLQAVHDVFAVNRGAFKVLVVKSTVPPSTVAERVKPYVDELSQQYGTTLGLASNPEFLREGHAWDDFINPDRIVIGVEDELSKDVLSQIYFPFNAPIYYVNYNSAEFIKYLSNTLLSTLISFSNEMAMIAERIGNIDVAGTFKILHQDKRWFGAPAGMATYVYPGCGYGGYCLPKDTAALSSIAQNHGYRPLMLEANLHVNEEIKENVANKIAAAVPRESTIGILGLAFKGGSDDVRLSPSLFVIEKLLSKGYRSIVAYDPMANKAFADEYQLPIRYAQSLEELVDQADELVLLTNWPEFRQHEALLGSKRLFDFRYVFADGHVPVVPKEVTA